MAADDDYPTRDEIEDLKDLMEQSGWQSDLIDDHIEMAALDRDHYDDMWEAAWVDAAGEHGRDDYWPYEDYSGEIMIGRDPEGRPLGVTRRQLDEHMLVVGPFVFC